MSANNLILYNNIVGDEILRCITDKSSYHSALGQLVEFAHRNSLSGNIWQCYISYLVITSENSYSLSCEMSGDTGGSISAIAQHDMKIIFNIFNDIPIDLLPTLTSYKQPPKCRNSLQGLVIQALSQSLAEAPNETRFKEIISEFYNKHGVGKFALNHAFNLSEHNIAPVYNPDPILLDDLIGYSSAKKSLTANTEAFIAGKKANNCLLFGSAGTGKSSCVKAILNEYSSKGLRLVELYKHQLRELGTVINRIKDRNYKFIIFMDDLSFEEFEVEYKYLKAVIDGSVGKKPENILIYATSNRRHLIKEEYSDRDGLYASETIQEKTSLSARFGEMIFFDSPGKKEYNEIVKALAKREGLDIGEEELALAANSWEMSHSGKSGRTARQLIDYLLGNQK